MISHSTTGAITLETPETCEQHGGRRYRQQKYLHFVRDAVHAVAQALHNLQASLCGPGATGLCDDMRHIDSDLLRTYLANVTFNGESTATYCSDIQAFIIVTCYTDGLTARWR
jgi:hypothetical protein